MLTAKQRDRLKAVVVRLRTSNLPQEQCWLRTINGYCATGVIADCMVNSPEGRALGIKWDIDRKHKAFYYWLIEEAGYGLGALRIPLIVQSWAGITEEQSDEIVRLNDQEDKSFQEIADYIEKEILGE